MFHSVSLVVAFGTIFSQLEPSLAFYYNQYPQYQGGNGQPMMLPLASDLYPAAAAVYAQQRSDNEAEQESNGNAYTNPAALYGQQQQAGIMQNMYIQNDEPSQSDSQYYAQMSRQQMLQQQQPQDVCATGFVEHCLVRANADGEQRLMLASMIANRTVFNNEQATLTSEFDGMCHVVTRFIDCLNAHYLKCSPLSGAGRQQQLDHQKIAHAKDVFAESWGQLCAPDSSVRRSKLPFIFPLNQCNFFLTFNYRLPATCDLHQASTDGKQWSGSVPRAFPVLLSLWPIFT